MLLINEEYKKFLNQRDAIKNYINDTNKKLISNLYDMELPNLNNILLSKFTLTQDTNLTCLICKKFVGINKKSLSKHKQTCAKNNNNIVSDEESSTNDCSVNDETIEHPTDVPIEKPTKQLTKNKKINKNLS
jgi:DNA-binding protein Fis